MNKYYNEIGHALYVAACVTIPQIKQNFYKYWWDEELNQLKDKAIESFNLWFAFGKPRNGKEYDDMRQDKLSYKYAIKTKE